MHSPPIRHRDLSCLPWRFSFNLPPVFLLQRHVKQSISARQLLPAKARLVVAVSGGVDSMVLLHVLAELSPEYGWELVVAHLNHQLRGNSSLADERLVRRTARALQLPVIVSRVDVKTFARSHKLSLEMAARTLRHDFLARTAVQNHAAHVALAHHLDDQVELFFLRLFRGAGSQGLAGMKWVTASPSNSAVTLVRPLLDCSKQELLAYASEHGVVFRHDATNAKSEIQRNRIRHELLPMLQRNYQVGLRTNIGHLMDILGAEAELIDSLAQSWLSANLRSATASPTKRRSRGLHQNNDFFASALSRTPFEILPSAVQRRSVQRQLIARGIELDFDLVEHLRLNPGVPINVAQSSVYPAQRSQTNHPRAAALLLVREISGQLRELSRDTVPFRTHCYELNLASAQPNLEWGGVRLNWQIQPRRGAKRPKTPLGTEFFDADAVGNFVQLRHWQPGDRFQPIGMEHAIKLQDLFVNQKVAPNQRRQLLLATTSRGDIFWVEGLRISERFKLNSNTIRRLQWHWQRL